jgi:hypothetical protein
MNDAANADPDTLSVQVEGGRGEPDRLFVLARGRGGGASVEVREFRFAESETAGPLEYTAGAADLLATFERAHRERRRLSEDIYRIRNWLGSLPDA